MDWTEFAADGQATLMLSLLCRHGRATPLFWLSVETATLKDRRNGYEYQALVRLAEALPAGIKVCLVADRGFGDPAPARRHSVPAPAAAATGVRHGSMRQPAAVETPQPEVRTMDQIRSDKPEGAPACAQNA